MPDSASRDIRFNHWSKLTYHDPAVVLRRLRQVEIELAPVADSMDEKVRRLRTGGLKEYRERIDAAVFTYGMGRALQLPLHYTTEEASDYDFVVSWIADATQHFCPVQLKEWVPADLNPNQSLADLLAKLAQTPIRTETVLAIKLSRAGQLDFTTLQVPALGWKEAWFFWASAPNRARFTIRGDLLRDPSQFSFSYPEPPNEEL